MTLLQAQSLTVLLPHGEPLFSDVSLALDRETTALVGRNGSGKSVLAALLSGARQPDEGRVIRHSNIAYLPQLTVQNDLSALGTVAQALGVEGCLQALQRIAAGSCDPADFEAVGDQWDLPDSLSRQLAELGLPPDPGQSCASLSGGELTRLRLWLCFRSDAELLILDEPSNHLDRHGRQWLSQQITRFQGGILLVSHDQSLLKNADRIYELSHTGLACYGTDFMAYRQQKHHETQLLATRLSKAKQQINAINRQHQRNEEKAQRRAAAGNRDRHAGSQSTLLLDYQKNAAESAVSSRKHQQNQQLEHAQQQLKSLQDKVDTAKPLSFSTDSANKRSARLLTTTELSLHRGQFPAISRTVWYGDKIHLRGSNGTGKSTLLKTLLGDMPVKSGEIHRHGPLCYLDQHFSLFDLQATVIDNLMRLCPAYTAAELRTLAACIGFRRERVGQQMSTLSGGERMRLAMLVVSHQQQEGVLLLDEPDNHLDVDGKSMMAQALSEHKGSFILVSHDQDFVDACGVNQRWDLSR
ncbi:ATP-binding cassette domain-containing protein [Photobacterium halotolerans]|uniref:ATP-binding cassette domain-containing protein n=1 Tax=Photobacterium halotolerans TaxID=265726 RepID=UPI001372FB6F|nr:ATP-binding cassette domain-containing protein [Photobacterium halotolerans]NAW87349.1 ATP-binding cassette domain-containing protein [Photobacterium halotolerans]